MTRTPIDFAGLAAAALQQIDTLVPRWLPAGIERNGRWYVGDFDGQAGESANVNLATGQWIDNAAPDQDKGGDLISLKARILNMNNGQAALALMDELGWAPLAEPARPSSVRQAAAVQTPASDAPAPGPAAASPATAGGPVVKAERWRPVVPVPPHAPAPKFTWAYKDKKQGDQWIELDAVQTWTYEFEGQRFGYVARFERINSSGELVKDTLPLTWCEDTTDGRGGHRWHWKQWLAPRPLYVPATLLSNQPGADRLPVVVVEGEKCAHGGHVLLGHEFDFVSWPGGCKAWALAAWGWLMGRTVYLWPDCDAQRVRLSKAERDAGVDPATKDLLPAHKQPGLQAMVHIGQLLVAELGCTVYLCQIPQPGAVAAGWDIADAIAQGWGADQVRAFIRSAAVFVPPNDEARAAVGGAAGAGSTRSRAAAGVGPDAGAEGEAETDSAWRKYLLETDKFAIKAVRENVVLALDGWPDKGVRGVADAAGLIVFNEFTNNVEKTRPTPWGTQAGPWLEADELLMGEWLVRQHYMPSMARGTLEESVLMVAHRNSVHPLRTRIEALRGQWDNTKRLAGWLERCVFAADDPTLKDPQLRRYLSRVGTWFVMAMCARVMVQRKVGPLVVCGPGVKFDYMLILEGPQGWGKSTLASVLGGEHFADTGLSIGEKDSLMNIQGVWLYEWGELENMSKQEVGKVKLFISSPKDRFRATFDRRPRDYPRQVVFVGTTNEANYLTDVTGNRRFWPVRISRAPDKEWLTENLDQLLAEAVAYVDAGERFYPTRDEQRKLFDPQQKSRTVENAIEAGIRHYLYDDQQKVPHGGRNGALVAEIGLTELLKCIGFEIDKQTDVVVKRAGSVMHAMGWSVRRTSQEGRPRVYVRPADVAQSDEPQAVAGGSDGSTTPTQGDNTAGAADDCPF